MICFDFLNMRKAGIDFGEGIIKLHPKLEDIRVNPRFKKQIIDDYTDDYYLNHQNELVYQCRLAQSEWVKKEKLFFKVCSNYFLNLPWPAGKYKAYLSIFNCNPRFLEDKTFQVYWKHPKRIITVVCHEMLHFIFYNLISRSFSKRITEEELWQLSEVMNYFLLKEPQYIGITKDPYPDLYPQLRDLANRYLPVWKSKKDVSKFLKTYYLNKRVMKY